MVDTVELLEELTEQLQQVTEFAVDLEVQRVYSGPYSCSCLCLYYLYYVIFLHNRILLSISLLWLPCIFLFSVKFR